MLEKWADAFTTVFAPNILLFLGKGLLNTLYIAAVSIVLSLIFGTVLGLMRNTKERMVRWAATGYIEIVRNIPLALFIIAMRFLTKLPPLESGIAAMTVFTSAIVAEIVRGGLNSVGKGQWEAATSQGFSRTQTMWYVITRRRSGASARRHFPVRNDHQGYFVLRGRGTYELSFTSKIVAAHRTIVTAEDILLLYLLVAMIYYVINRLFSGIARRQRGNAMKGVVR
jgi:putative glutamine transport system permease protein